MQHTRIVRRDKNEGSTITAVGAVELGWRVIAGSVFPFLSVPALKHKETALLDRSNYLLSFITTRVC